MKPERQGAGLLLVVAAALVTFSVVPRLERWLGAVPALARSPLVPGLAGLPVLVLVAMLLARATVTRRVLRSRVRFALVPADSFDPSPEAVVAFAAGLGRARRLTRAGLDARASAVRVQLDTDADGRLRYTVELPAHARAALNAALGAYADVELHEIGDEQAPTLASPAARAELVPARSSTEPLRNAGLDPDPLAGFARALDTLHPRHGDHGVVCVDLLPLTAAARRRLRRRLLRRHRDDAQRGGTLAAIVGDGTARGRQAPAELVERRAEQRGLTAKLGSPEPLFALQVLVRTSSPSAGRAAHALDALLAAFDVFSGANYLRVSGLRLPGSGVFFGADLPLRRGRFDRRVETGMFRPARRRVVTVGEVAGLLAPPTVRCGATNVLRSGGVVPPPPPDLPTFGGQRELLPIGRIMTETGERLVGVPLASTFFTYIGGRSRFGKTETAIGQFVHLARAGHGAFFLDPHEDAIRRIETFLTDDVRERVYAIDLAAGDRQPAWNVFAAARPNGARVLVHEQVDAVVDAFAAAMQWSEVNTRALNLTAQAATALAELSLQLPPALAPTLFTMPSLLGDDDWRAAILPFLSEPTRAFFTERFPRLPAEAITPVTNVIDRLRSAPAVAAFLGNPRSSYDVRTAMDRGQIVLACPGDGGTRDRLVAALLLYDVLHAAKTRAAIPPQHRRPFYLFADEVQTYDSPTLPALLEQTAKYGLRAILLNQDPERLSSATRQALLTNRSHMLVTALGARAAALLAREWSDAIASEVVTRLRRYDFLASVTLDGESSAPFRLHGIAADELHPDAYHPDELPALHAAIDRTTGRRPVADTLAALDGHERRILEHLHAARRGGDARRGGSAAHGRRTLDLDTPR